MKTSLIALISAFVSVISISQAHAALPALPHTASILLDLATRSSVEIEAISGLDSSRCSSVFKPIEITEAAHLKIGNETYIAKKWLCVSEHADSKLDGFLIQYEHAEFHQQISLTVYANASSIIENRAVRPLIVSTAY